MELQDEQALTLELRMEKDLDEEGMFGKFSKFSDNILEKVKVRNAKNK